jgi:hypothetical protein
MKKRISGWIIVLLLIVLTAYVPVKHFFETKQVDKSISIDIYKENNYRSKIYNTTSAQIHVVIEKVRNKNRIVAWDSTFDAKLLKKYPAIENAISQKITISNVADKKEHLEIKYLITYNSNGNILQIQSGTFLLKEGENLGISL